MSDLDERMREAGMMTIDEMVSGSPIDKWHCNTGVTDLDSFHEWLEMKLREMLHLRILIELGDGEGNELYEWALAHSAVLQSVLANFRKATTPPPTEEVSKE